ncbi:unnamed protein product [Pseudo-nitzschia multistriata]|uniref:Uncharacterized protein n=1 Tax=Pseudo-nitzschia multistriata TaxID=183589 RepID=A0A448ZI68_9STRA|nr:unnamed protein product [Pseudo-nitzschia multistriata]
MGRRKPLVTRNRSIHTDVRGVQESRPAKNKQIGDWALPTQDVHHGTSTEAPSSVRTHHFWGNPCAILLRKAEGSIDERPGTSEKHQCTNPHKPTHTWLVLASPETTHHSMRVGTSSVSATRPGNTLDVLRVSGSAFSVYVF